MENKIINKIVDADPTTYVIFFDYGCRYSEGALELLRKSSKEYKGYQIVDIDGGLNYLISVLNKHKSEINFDPSHKTKPVIFINKNFIGGYTELEKIFNHHG